MFINPNVMAEAKLLCREAMQHLADAESARNRADMGAWTHHMTCAVEFAVAGMTILVDPQIFAKNPAFNRVMRARPLPRKN